jgi:hypothetical protein
MYLVSAHREIPTLRGRRPNTVLVEPKHIGPLADAMRVGGMRTPDAMKDESAAILHIGLRLDIGTHPEVIIGGIRYRVTDIGASEHGEPVEVEVAPV